jgi:hypothetical protein
LPARPSGEHQPSGVDQSAQQGAQRDFGAPIDANVPSIALAEILAAPQAHADHVVRTRGTVHQVCQRMGCWMELRDGDGPAVRVPMAGHAFFLPKDCAGRSAEVQGRVVLRALTPEMRAHLEGEGATAVASVVSIDASGVRLGAR